MSVKSKSLLFAIILALVAVSTISIIMIDHDNSSAASIRTASNYDELVYWVNNADAGDTIVITDNIDLKSTIRITKPLYLTTNCNATIRPAVGNDPFVPAHYLGEDWPVLFHVDGNYTDHSTQGKLVIGTSTTPNDNEILTLDGNNQYMVIYCEKRGNALLPEIKNTITLNSGIITNGKTGSSGAGLVVTRAATFEMNGGSIINNHLDPTRPSYHVYQYSEDVWVGSGAEATINNGTIGKLFVRAWYDQTALGGKITLNGGTIGTIYLDHCYYTQTNPIKTNGASLIYPEESTATLGHLMISTSKNVYNNPITFKYAEEPNPVKGDTYKGGSHVAMVNGFGYKSLDDAVKAAKDGDTVTIIGDVDLDSRIDVGKNITLAIDDYYISGTNSMPYILNPNDYLFFNVTVIANGNLDVPANWTKNGGIYTGSYVYGTQISDIVNSLEAPERTGYRFTGWSYTDGAIGTVSANITANYTVNSYKIHLHHGTDGFSHGAATVDFDSNSVLIHEIPKKIGHRLVGFFTHETDGTMVLNADGTFASDNVDDHITDGKWSKAEHHTLYAQWELDESSDINPMIIIIATAIEAAIVIGVTALVRRR